MEASLSALTREALAHLASDGRLHLLIDHLRAVGEGAREFAEKLSAAE